MFGSKKQFMQKKLFYIISITAAWLTACTSEVTIPTENFLNGIAKTPIAIESNVLADVPVARAVNDRFEANEQLVAFLRHVNLVGEEYQLVNSAEAGTPPLARLVNLQVESLTTDHHNVANNFNQAAASKLVCTDEQGLYWDDFSEGGKGDATDIRTDNHFLQSYYGYCYNGGSPSVALTPNTGVLEWTVATNQTSGFKTSDLLWSPTQTPPLAYIHGSNNTITGRDGVLAIPYTHAMSKVTIAIECEEGFVSSKNNFTGASVVLKNMNTVCTLSAPNATVTASDTPANITMQPIANTNLKQSFSALIARTEFSNEMEFALINQIDGNNYKLVITDAILNTSEANDWASQLDGYTNETKSGTTKPGVHYLITVKLKKQEIKVQASILPWDEVEATGNGQIVFNNNVKDQTGDIADGLKVKGFDLYKSATTTFGTKKTTVSWNNTAWEYNPIIYWQSSSDNSYFRALSGAPTDDPDTGDNESLVMTLGTDVLWGTTAEHTGKDENNVDYSYDRGAQIKPRTSNVPLEFEHAMSKITVKLSTTTGDDKVDLDGATISIVNIYDKGKIALVDGAISQLEVVKAMPITGYLAAESEGEGNKLKDVVVIPQKLTFMADGTTPRNGAVTFNNDGTIKTNETNGKIVMMIMLADHTTYVLDLATCLDEEDKEVTEWKRGKHYTYTITLAKAELTFRAMVKEWEEKKGNGNATLEWD